MSVAGSTATLGVGEVTYRDDSPPAGVNPKASKVNLQIFAVGAVALTVEKTLKEKTQAPTITIDLREAMPGLNTFNNETKYSFQLSPDDELIDFLSVLLTIEQKCSFSYHGGGRNKSLIAEWTGVALKLVISSKGKQRWINLSRTNVFMMSLMCAEQLSQYLVSTGMFDKAFSPEALIDFIQRTHRRFRTIS